MRQQSVLRLALLTATLAAPLAASAQSVAPTPGSPNAIPEKQAPDTNLSDKLDKTDGVIKPPPSGDADMTIAPPASGSRTPVIPPSAVPPTGAPADGAKPEPK